MHSEKTERQRERERKRERERERERESNAALQERCKNLEHLVECNEQCISCEKGET